MHEVGNHVCIVALFLQEILSKADSDADKEIDFAEFVKYMTDHEKKLKLAFGDLDRNKDG